MLLLKNVLKFILCFVLGGVSNRTRGMHHDWIGSTAGRLLFYATPAALCQMALFPAKFTMPGEFAYLLALIFGNWLGLIIAGWGNLTDLNEKRDAGQLAVRGIALTFFAGLVIAQVDTLAGEMVMASGALMLPGYMLGFKTPSGQVIADYILKKLGSKKTIKIDFLNVGQEWGEVWTGSLLWGAWFLIAKIVSLL